MSKTRPLNEHRLFAARRTFQVRPSCCFVVLWWMSSTRVLITHGKCLKCNACFTLLKEFRATLPGYCGPPKRARPNNGRRNNPQLWLQQHEAFVSCASTLASNSLTKFFAKCSTSSGDPLDVADLWHLIMASISLQFVNGLTSNLALDQSK